MNDLDRKIREALGPDEAELLRPIDEPPLLKQVAEIFHGKKRWLAVVISVALLVFVVFAVVSAVCFFWAEGVREMIAWAGGFGLGLVAATASRMWFWMELNKNAVTREIKRVQLQMARLASTFRKAP